MEAMPTKNIRWPEIIHDISGQGILTEALTEAASSLEKLVGQPIKANGLAIEILQSSQLAKRGAASPADVVGIQLLSTSEIPGQTILILSLDDAQQLLDWLLPGQTKQMGDMERSALAEVGNVVLYTFLVNLLQASQEPLQPALPKVMVGGWADFVATLTSAGDEWLEKLLVVKTAFVSSEEAITVQFWVIPDPGSLNLNGVKST